MMWWGSGMAGAGWVMMILNVLASWALVVVLSLALVRGFGGAGATTQSMVRDPSEILAERLARGEINPEEYRSRLDALRPTTG